MASVVRRLAGGSRRGLQAEEQGLTGALVFFFAIRWAAWLVALFGVLFGGLEPEHTRLEPYLLVFTFIYIAAGTLYVPFLHGLVRRSLPLSRLGRIDLRAVACVDVLVSFGLLYASGG